MLFLFIPFSVLFIVSLLWTIDCIVNNKPSKIVAKVISSVFFVLMFNFAVFACLD